MATKKKVSETAEGVFSVASEDFSIVWGGSIYDFTAGNPIAIPTELLAYLAKSDKVHALYPATSTEEVEVEVEVVAEPEVIETPEEPTEEVL
jgi:hypothetical protein